MSEEKIYNICWFRKDLRLADNEAIASVSDRGVVLPIYILDDRDVYPLGSASNYWLYKSLEDLNKSLDNKLSIYLGNPIDILKYLISNYRINSVSWNRLYDPHSIKRDKEIKEFLKAKNILCKSFSGNLLFEPWEILKKDGSSYKVFTPFYNECLKQKKARFVTPVPRLNLINKKLSDISLKDLNLLDTDLSWYNKFDNEWEVSEKGAQIIFNSFIKNNISNYKIGRDYPSKNYVSRISPYIAFGQISVNQIYNILSDYFNNPGQEHFIRELYWREFSYNLLYHFPQLPSKNFQKKFNKFAWKNNMKMLKLWQKGLTGYPIIDAGMRELWQTGYMHNRVRMIVASFLTKNLLIDWRYGFEWFWDCLLDADLANNSASWQWVAGSGVDAAPYFRIFNPVIQSKRFDPDGEYIRKYLPELKNLPLKYLFDPTNAPRDILQSSGVVLGVNYPESIVDLKKSRIESLSFYKNLQN